MLLQMHFRVFRYKSSGTCTKSSPVSQNVTKPQREKLLYGLAPAAQLEANAANLIYKQWILLATLSNIMPRVDSSAFNMNSCIEILWLFKHKLILLRQKHPDALIYDNNF